MKLKDYQERTPKEVKIFMEQLAFWRGRAWQSGEIGLLNSEIGLARGQS